jgi:hypothetical protein
MILSFFNLVSIQLISQKRIPKFFKFSSLFLFLFFPIRAIRSYPCHPWFPYP